MRAELVLFLLLISAPSFASAQRVSRMPIWNEWQISTQTTVQAELHLSDAQKASLGKLSDKATAELADVGQLALTPKETIDTTAELIAQQTKALEAILQPQQIKRLHEVSLQYWMAIDPTNILVNKLAGPLSLTDDQKEKLISLRSTQRAAYLNTIKGTKLVVRDARSRALLEEQKTEALRVLTAIQRQLFDELQGDEFDIRTIDDYAKPTRTNS